MIRLIKNNSDYENALSQIDSIFDDAQPGSAEYDELEVLATLVEIYEEKNFPIDMPNPIDAIKFRMEQLGLNQKDMIPYFGSKSKVSEVLNGKRNLSLSMMRNLNKNLGIPAEVLLKEPGCNSISNDIELDLSKFPVNEMINRNWLPNIRDTKEKYKDYLEKFISDNGGFKTLTPGFLRQGQLGRYNPKMDEYSVMAWCLRAISLAKKNELPIKYVKNSIKLTTLKEIAKLSYFNDGPLLAKEYLSKLGIHLVIIPHLPKTYLDGAAILMPDGTPVVALSLRYDRIDNFWFTLSHEIAHVSLHLSDSDRFIIDDLDQTENEIDPNSLRIEKEADNLASEGLLPKSVWAKKPFNGRGTAEKIINFALKLKIHPAIIAGRIRYENEDYKIHSRLIGRKQIRKHFI